MQIEELKRKKQELDRFIKDNSSNLYEISYDSLMECIDTKRNMFKDMSIQGRVREILKEAWCSNNGVPEEIRENFNNYFNLTKIGELKCLK